MSAAFLAGSTIVLSFALKSEKLFPIALSISLFLASDTLLIKLLSTSLIPVHNVLASSKSPMISLHVSVHPEPSASFVVSRSCVNVFTFVAASPAVFAMSAICLASSCVYPLLTNFCTAASYSACVSAAVANMSKVSVRTSVVSQPVDNDSLNEPFASIAALAPVLRCSEVFISASWNT